MRFLSVGAVPATIVLSVKASKMRESGEKMYPNIEGETVPDLPYPREQHPAGKICHPLVK